MRFPNLLCCSRWYVFGLMSLLLPLALPCELRAASRTWDGGGANNLASTPANWVDDTAPVAGDDIVLDATTDKAMTWDQAISVGSWTQVGYTGTVTITTVYGASGFTNLVITGDCVISNGTWTHTINSLTEVNRLRATIGGDLVVGSNALISAKGAGYAYRKGPGGSTASGASGASHGGRGGGTYVQSVVGKHTYGSVIAPTNLGSGGNSRAGGGAIRLDVSGQTRVDGTITARAQSDYDYYAGAGGSIWLTSGALTGSGTIAANGGTGWNGPGGGGRVSLVVTNTGADFSSFAGLVSAYGGPNKTVGATSAAGPGTVYLETPAHAPGNGELVIDNNGLPPYGVWGTCQACLGDLETVTYDFSRITLTNNGVLILGSNNTLVVTNTLLRADAAGTVDGILIDGGTLTTADDFAYSNFYIRIPNTGVAVSFSPATSLAIGTNAVLYIDQAHTLACDVIVEAGGNVSHWGNLWYGAGQFQQFEDPADLNWMDLTIDGDLTVEANGRVDVTGQGYKNQEGPGYDGQAGSHGGRGEFNNTRLAYGPCYGSLVAPTLMGSGGGSSKGGGAIVLNVSGQIQVDGIIAADGENWSYYTGSGGSVWITSGTLVGGGAIRANGGDATHSVGGGGRVSLAVTNAGADFSSLTGTVTAYRGNKAGANWAGAGTVYLRTAAQGADEGTLIIDSGNAGGTSLATEISSNVTDTVVGNVICRNKAWLVIDTNQSLTVQGVWSNAADFTAYEGGQVIFAGDAGSTSTIHGATTFTGLVCTNGIGKTLVFPAGVTNSVAAGGILKLNGGETETNLFLRSSSDGTAWKLNVDATVDQNVVRVDAKDSDALAGVGAQITAINSQDSGGNSNWVFVTVTLGATNTWTGSESTAWSVATNWSLNRGPTEDDVVLIPGSCPRYPVLDAARTVYGLDIRSGASLDLDGADLTVLTDATVAGAITALGTETMTLNGDVDFTGAAVAPAHGTLVLAGTAAQSVNLAGSTLYKVRVDNSVGTVAFTAGFTATELRCEAASGTRSVAFQQGATVTLRDLVLLGSAATTNITLRSSSTGQKWNLIVSGYQSVRGVDVRDSDADLGDAVTAAASKDSGNNDNWLFGATWASWLGTTSSDFGTAANWSPAVVPGATSRVLVETSNAMAIASPVTILDLTVGGGGGEASVTVDAALIVVEDVVVLGNGTLALNRPSTVSNGLYVLSGGLLTHTENNDTEVNKLNVTVHGDVGVDPGGEINATAKGYARNEGPGRSQNAEGASHGGVGGGLYGATGYGPCYGSITSPTNLGSGGSYPDEFGGGAVILNVLGQIRNDGVICADGSSYPANLSATQYTAAGGSVFLTAGALTGIGAIRANGGDTPGNGTGGGGRISLVVTNAGADFSSHTGTITAHSGTRYGQPPTAHYAGAGTVYMQTAADGADGGSLLIENADLPYSRHTIVSPDVTDAVVGDVILRNAGWLVIATNQSLTLSGVWSNAGSFRAELGSRVAFGGDPSSTSRLYGDTTFMGLHCTNGLAKSIIFEAGSATTVDTNGVLRLNGAAGSTNLVLRSSQDGTPWQLSVAPSVDQSVSYVDVKDSDALTGGGAEIVALNAIDRGDNSNWVFMAVGVGETNVWTGASNTVWSINNNWSLGRSPISDDIVRIPTGRPRYPVLDDARSVSGLEIQSGASLSLNEFGFTVTGDAAVGGEITASATEIVTLQGDVDFTGGDMAPARCTIVFAGAADQSADLADVAFYNLRIDNSVGTVAFTGGFSATELRCEAESGTRTITFLQGATAAVRDLILLGSTTTTNISLRSSNAGQKWNLAVSGYQSVRGVDVQDSDAGPGQAITATQSKDSGNNDHWIFGATWSEWLGTTSAAFDLAANWSPASVPGAMDRVLVATNNPLTIGSPVTVLDLTIGGGAGAASVAVEAALTVVEDIVLLNNSTLVMDRPGVISNNVIVFAGGMLTHSANTDSEVNKLQLQVYGDLCVAEGGTVDVQGKGYGAIYGPGNTYCGGSYGGRAWETLSTKEGPCYGSIVAPTNLGSGGKSHAGGGAILLNVSGQTRIDGVLSADGGHSTLNGYAGSGGSIRIVSGTLIGAGTIRSDARQTAYQGSGAGGRISLVVSDPGADFSLLTGTVRAYGGDKGYGGTGGGAGTVYKQCPADGPGRGTVWVDTVNVTYPLGRYTDVPPATNYVSGEADWAVFHVLNMGTLRLTTNFTVRDIWLDTADARLDLNGNTLTVKALEHEITPGSVVNYGEIVWGHLPYGTCIKLR